MPLSSMCTVWLLCSKWLSKYSNESASHFVLSLAIPLWKLFEWFRSLPLNHMGNWWLAALSRQCSCSCVTSYTEVFGETSNHPCDSAPLQPRFGALWLLVFPKTKITFEREEISDCWWNAGKYQGAADGWQLGELCEVPRCLLWGLSHHCFMDNVSCVFLTKCLFHITWLDTF